MVSFLETGRHLWDEWVHYGGEPDTHVGEDDHDVVLHSGVPSLVQDLTEGRDDLLRLLFILQVKTN